MNLITTINDYTKSHIKDQTEGTIYPKVAFMTLGCKVNQYETEAMEELFLQNQYDLVNFDEIADVRDESSSDVRIVVEVKKGRNVENLLNGIFKKTPLEDTYSVNMLAVRDKQPKVFSLKGILEEFLAFEEELYTKEYTHLLEKAKSRAEVVEGLIKAVDVIDLIIEVLRGSESIKQAKDCLVNGNITEIKFKSEASKKAAKEFDFTEPQADAILAMPLSRLIGLEVLKLSTEAENLKNNIEEYNNVTVLKDDLFDEISNQENSQGIIFLYSKNLNSINDICGDVVILDDIQDPGNVGTIMRTMEAANFKNLILTKGSVDVYNPKTVRATMGGIFNLNIIYETPENIVEFLKEKKYLTISTALHENSVSYNEIDQKERNAFIFGNEGGGVSDYFIENSDIKAIIPIYGNIESLNVSIAVGIFLYKMREKQEEKCLK